MRQVAKSYFPYKDVIPNPECEGPFAAYLREQYTVEERMTLYDQ